MAPQSYFDLYPLQGLEPTINASDDRDDIPLPAITGKQPDYGMNTQGCREALQAYYACITFMDAQVGRLLDIDEIVIRRRDAHVQVL